MTSETILKRALAAQRKIDEGKEMLKYLEAQALEHFPEDSASGELIHPEGIIKLKRTTNWYTDPDEMEEAQMELGLLFDDVFEVNLKRSVPNSAIDQLYNDLGSHALNYIVEERSWNVLRAFQHLAKTQPEHTLVQAAIPFVHTNVVERVSFKGAR